jgi:outer membrane protein assembly factor BamD (BamD/ComL family)
MKAFFLLFFSSALFLYTAAIRGDVLDVEQSYGPDPAQEHHRIAVEALHARNWSSLERESTFLIEKFPNTQFGYESYFFLARAYLEMEEYDLANENYEAYLHQPGRREHFQEAMAGRLFIADQFRDGKKRHLFRLKFFPKWISAKEEAEKIYEEIASALPNHEFAARALLGRSVLLAEQRDYSAAVEQLQTLIRRFPRNRLSADAFLEIQRVYLRQLEEEFPDPGLLELAELNLGKFQKEFPSDSRLELAEQCIKQMQEIYASAFYATGQFYERTKKPNAALIYYHRVLKEYPGTATAKAAHQRMTQLEPSKE